MERGAKFECRFINPVLEEGGVELEVEGVGEGGEGAGEGGRGGRGLIRSRVGRVLNSRSVGNDLCIGWNLISFAFRLHSRFV